MPTTDRSALPPGHVPSPEELPGLVERIRAAGKRRGPLAIAAVATMGSFLFGYDTGVIAGALSYMHLPLAAGGLELSSAEEGVVTSLLAFGAAFGALIGGQINDRIGRRKAIMLLAIIFLVGTIGCALAPNVVVISPFRFILGWAVGGASSTVPLYLAESAPKRIRGPVVAIDQFMIVFGQFIAYSMNAAISRMVRAPEATVQSDPTGQFEPGETVSWDALQQIEGLVVADGNGHAWRWMLILATLPALVLWIGMRVMPESPRWYAANQRYYDVIASLKQLRDPSKDGAVTDEVAEMIDLERQQEKQEEWSLRRGFAKKWTRRLIWIGIGLGIFDQLTGINTAMWYMPTILSAAGFSTADALLLNVLTGFVSAVGSLLGLWLVAKFMRRHVGMAQEFGIAVSLFLLAALFHFGIEPHMSADGSVGDAVPLLIPWLILAVVSLFIFIKQAGTVTWVLLAEIFPAKIRGASQGISVGALWFFNGIVALVFPVMMTSLGGSKTYLIFALINVVAFLFYWKVVPETKDVSLEEFEEGYRTRYGD
ncbi:sugar porter family MFS transporter [Brachybacterium sacelli]